MTKELKHQFTEEQLQATPKEILQVLFGYLNKEINSANRETMFLETTLTRTKNKILPALKEKLEIMIDNNESQNNIKKHRKNLNQCISDYNQTIDNYENSKKYIKLLENNALMISKFL